MNKLLSLLILGSFAFLVCAGIKFCRAWRDTAHTTFESNWMTNVGPSGLVTNQSFELDPGYPTNAPLDWTTSYIRVFTNNQGETALKAKSFKIGSITNSAPQTYTVIVVDQAGTTQTFHAFAVPITVTTNVWREAERK